MEPESTVAEGAPGRGHTLRDVAILVVLAAVLGLPSFFTRDPWNPDEPRYVEVAREMVVLHDYVVPHLNGELYPDKPPLFFWLASCVYRAGVGITSGRVVAVLANLATLLLVYFFGRRLLPGPGALLAALITATTFLFLWILKAGVIDPLLTLLTTTALIAAYYALRGEGRRLALWVVFYAAGGLAVLTKGPVGFLVPAVVVLPYALLNRKRIAAGGWAHAAGAGAFVVLVGAWLLAVRLHAGAAYTHEIIFGQAAVYTVARHISHGHGPHYYFMMIPAYLFPWIFFVVLGLAQSWRAWRRDGDLDAAFLFVWFVAIFLLFTAIPAKRDRYLLPLVPCAGLLCARYFVLGLRDGFRRPKLHRRLLLVMLVVMGVAALFLGATPWLARLWVRKFYGGEAELREHLQFLTSPGGIAIAAAVSLVLLAVVAAGIRAIVTRPQSLRPVWALLAWMVLLSLVLDLLAFPIMNPIKSGRSFAAAALPYLRDADESRMFGDEYSGVINLYTGIVSIPVIQDETALLKMLEQPGGTGRIAVITDMKRYERIREKLPPGLSVAVQERIGHRSMLLLCNWPIPGAG